MKENKVQIKKKNVIWNIVGSTANALISLIFVILVTRINGLDMAGIFSYSFATACLFFVIGIYQGRTFQVTDLNKENYDTDYIYNKITTCMIMLLVSIGFVLIKGYDLLKCMILITLCLYKLLDAFAESLYSIIQKQNELDKVGKSLFVKAVGSCLIFLIIDVATKNLLASCISITVVNLLVCLFYDMQNVKKHEIRKRKYEKEANLRLLKTGFCTFIFTFLGMYLINVPRYAIDDLLTNELQSIFSIIIMPATFMALVGQYIMQPVLNEITNCIQEKNDNKLKKIILSLSILIFGIGFLVFIIAYFLEEPVLSFIYHVELKPYIPSMLMIVGGSILYSFATILANILVAMRKTKVEAILYGIISIIATILAYQLVERFTILGASLSYLIAMLLLALVFCVYLAICMQKFKNNNV